MGKDLLEPLWESVPKSEEIFQPEKLSGLPEPVKRYLGHAIAPGTRLATVCRLKMQGEIKLKDWAPFEAEQVIHRDRGMIWRAKVKIRGVPIWGFDRIIDGAGEMRWRLLGIIPVGSGSGPDISRSASGRLAAELVWLPSALLHFNTSWTETGPLSVRANLSVQGYQIELDITVDERGRLATVYLKRWGNPDGGKFRQIDFGAIVEAENAFDGYTIPSRLRVGWFFIPPQFEEDGEFLRVTIDNAEYR